MKKALIIGAFGQDGTLLWENLQSKKYEILGIGRGKQRATHSKFPPVDITQKSQVEKLLVDYKPDEIYYLAAVHHSSEDKELKDEKALFQKSYEINVTALTHFLEGMVEFLPQARLFYAASSHIFGRPKTLIQDENTALNAENVYGKTKVLGLLACRDYRNRLNLFTAVGILYNHESSLRDDKFISRKIIKSAVAIKNQKSQELVVGDLSAEIDWGYAPDYVEAMQRILNLPSPDDFVIATGQKHSVEEFIQTAFDYLSLDCKKFVKVDPNLITKQNVSLVGNSEKLAKATGWKPSVSFKEMIKILIDEEIKQNVG